MEREKVAEVLIDFIEKKNLGDEILITLPQAKIGFGRASQRPILYELASQTEAVPSPDHKEQPAEPDSTTFATEHLYFARAPSLLIN